MARRAGALATAVPWVGADHVEAEVHAGGEPRGGEDLAVLDVEDVGLEVDGREAAGQLGRVPPYVVAARPSSSPAWARTNAPVQMAAIRQGPDRARPATGLHCEGVGTRL
jgi:hypothetical protein